MRPKEVLKKMCAMALGVALVVPLFIMLTSFQSGAQLLNEADVDDTKAQVNIKSQLSEQQADEIVKYLKENGVEPKKEKTRSEQLQQVSENTWEIYVNYVDAVEAILLLDEAGLPKKANGRLFDEYLRRQRMESKMSPEELELAFDITEHIQHMEGISSAEVFFTTPEDNETDDGVMRVTVYVTHFGALDDPHSETAMEIRSYVLENVPGLQDENLVLIKERALPESSERLYNLPY